jgi:AcrR family transcriptional regulator
VNIDRLDLVEGPVKSRRYDNTRRREQSQRTRGRILSAARALIIENGYSRTTIAQIAAGAAVNTDTVYATVGRKPEIMAALVEAAISGQDVAVPADDRAYVQRIESTADARSKLEIYAAAIVDIHGRLAPVVNALRTAALTDGDCRLLWERIAQRRADNMLRFAASLRSTGALRPDLTDGQVADAIWSMNAPEYWELLVVQRGWTPDAFRDWLADAWTRSLLVRDVD